MGSHNYPRWVGYLSDQALAGVFGTATLRRGREYAEQSRVGHITVASQETVQAQVRGSSYLTYTVLVRLEAPHPTSEPSGASATMLARRVAITCTCPMKVDCKHGVALILHMRSVAQRRIQPAWQRALAPVVGSGEPSSGGTPLAIQYTVFGTDIELRPLYWGTRNTWARGQLGWDRLGFGYGSQYNTRQAQAMDRLYRDADQQISSHWSGYGARSSQLRLSEFSHAVWKLLAEARQAGVEFVAAKNTPEVDFGGAELEVVAELEPTTDGVVMRPVVRLGEQEVSPTALLGMPVHGALLRLPPPGAALMAPERAAMAGGPRVRAVGFTTPLDDARRHLLTMDAVTVPAAEVADFTFNYLPRLRDRVTVSAPENLELPAVEAPKLLVSLQPVSTADGIAPQLVVGVGFRYQAGESSIDVTTTRGSGSALRDHQAEQELRPLAEQVVSPSPPVLPAELVLNGSDALRLWGRLDALRANPDVVVEVLGEAPQYRELPEQPEVSLQVENNPGRDWFDLEVSVSVAGKAVPLPLLLRALSRGEDHLLLPDGDWFDLDHPELERLRELLAEASQLVDPSSDGSKLRLRPEHAGWWEELLELGVVEREAQAWREASERLLNLTAIPEIEAPDSLQATLRPYQLTGMRWMHFLQDVGLGGILADDMGLGKTLQTIAMVERLRRDDDLDSPVLVVAPSSVVGAWAEQAAGFAPELNVTTLTQTARKRRIPVAEAIAGAHLVVTSYAIARLDITEFEAIGWRLVVLDEAQFVKNRTSRTYQAMRRLPARARFALSGTPLENNLMDLWSMLSLTTPGLFPDPTSFAEAYRKPIEEGGDEAGQRLAQMLHRIRPVLLRRTKELVAPELPERQEQVLQVELNQQHRRIYDRHLNRERQRVMGLMADMDTNRFMILRSLTVLRQLSLSASLVEPEHEAVASAKIETLMELLADVVAGGHRALVFSQFTGFLKMAQQRIKDEGISNVYLDGRTRKRQERIDEFRQGDASVFLISLKAGGFGLTLTEADYVFVLDPWWNPAAEAQAIDRAHRIGQDRTVMVYRLVAKDTIEAKVVALQERKRELFSQVVDGGDQAVAGALSADDIRGLLAM